MIPRRSGSGKPPTIGEVTIAVRKLRDPRVTVGHRGFLLAALASRLPTIRPSVAQMGEDSNLSERQARRLLGDLVRWGYVRREKGEDPRHDPWIYSLNIDKISPNPSGVEEGQL